MAYRRSLITRSHLLTRRVNPSFGYVIHEDDGKKQQSLSDDSHAREIDKLLQRNLFGSSVKTSYGVGGAFFNGRNSHPLCFSSGMRTDFRRHMSTSVGENSDKAELLSDVSGVFSDTSMETLITHAPAVNEVAIAAADSWYPVAALQYLIDGIHSFTGLNWWASIALTTLLIRGATVPFLINQLKATTKLTMMRPKLESIQQEMQSGGMMDPATLEEGKRKMNQLFKEYGVTPWTPMKGLLIQGPVFVSFYLAITNMAEKVPSFKHGGALWFTDLSTPDSLYIFPCLAGLSFLITVECNMQEGLEGNPIAATMKKFSRGLAVLTVPFTMGFPKAIFCYWVTSNLFSLMYGLVIKRPEVKKYFNIPEIPPAPPGTVPKPAFSLSAAYKQYKEAVEQRPSVPAQPSVDPLKITDNKISENKISTSSVINQRLRSLEKLVKGRKKTPKK